MDINHLLAFVRQELNEVLKISSLEDLDLSSLEEGQAELIKGKLLRIDHAAIKVREYLQGEVANSEVPLFSGSKSLLTYFEHEYQPRADVIRNIAIFGDAQGVTLEDLLAGSGLSLGNPTKSSQKSTPILDAFDLATEQLENLLDYDPPEHLEYMADEELVALKELVSAKFFEPDEWHANMKELKPIVSSRRSEMLPGHVRERIKEIYRSFIFGNFQSVAAMSRGVMEYALIDRAGSLGYEAYENDKSGKGRPKSLRYLIDHAGEMRPHIASDMDAIREYGNDVMHPEKTKKIRSFLLSRQRAIDCIDRVKRVLEAVYS
ncbi:hypothetical protein FWJ25_13375 [Marinobacter salinexigens]|uniref:DUF4145 domain-containing protein n=1 Tax=Marinobacter salinexigens TaxID=2919747 RepID=A0A5B0VFJ7_9GAMM|nr:hypothetical protein [Marinobacter salinexigens]KAA1172799.1 hypothetical protein FWJ25_13375 [Marinobacter salinexigens]